MGKLGDKRGLEMKKAKLEEYKELILDSLMEGKSGLPCNASPSQVVRQVRKSLKESEKKGRLSPKEKKIWEEILEEFEAQVRYDPSYRTSLKRYKVSQRGKKSNVQNL